MWQLRILRPLGTFLGRPIQDTHNALWVIVTMWQQSRTLIAVILDIIIDLRRFGARRAVRIHRRTFTVRRDRPSPYWSH